jgi:uncharacterized protein YbjT (DUF2867 family)
MYIIIGATGHIGSKITESLLKQGELVGVIGRSADRLAPLLQRGAIPHVGSVEDADFMARACAGARAAFTMIPPNPQAKNFRDYQARAGAVIASAIAKAGVSHVVNLSSLGAHLDQGTGPIAGLHEQEARLNALPGLNVLHLRPAFFMENMMMNVDLIKSRGVNGTPLKGDLRFPVIATRDIAQAAAANLASLTFSGISVRELLGERDLTMKEMTRILGKAIGLPALPYVEFSYEEACKAMISQRVSRDVARLYAEMYQAYNEGHVTAGLVRTAQNTTETPFERFAEEFAVAYRKSPAAGRPAPEPALQR